MALCWVVAALIVIVLSQSWLVTQALSAATTAVERRRFSLLPWRRRHQESQGDVQAIPTSVDGPLGWALEERSTESWKFTVAWSGEPEVTVHLPVSRASTLECDTDGASTTDDLSTSLWDASVAAAILCRSPHLLEYMRSSSAQAKRVLELGSGVGLLGWVAAATFASTTTLSDHDTRAVALLQAATALNAGSVTARHLEWKDDHQSTSSSSNSADNAASYDIILAADVAYYFYLLRPLMDTIQAYLRKSDKDSDNGSMVWIAGQANRQSQWDLYDNMHQGCYNQLTDEQEGPWRPGQTRAFLYNLQVSSWCTSTTNAASTKGDVSDNTDSVNEQLGAASTNLPIMVIHHETKPALSPLYVFSPSDHIAGSGDRESIDISF